MRIEEFQFPKDWKVCRIADVFDFTRKPRGLDLSKNGDKIPFFPMNRIPLKGVHVSEFVPKPSAPWPNSGAGPTLKMAISWLPRSLRHLRTENRRSSI